MGELIWGCYPPAALRSFDQWHSILEGHASGFAIAVELDVINSAKSPIRIVGFLT
jgi:hypothetical protein